MGCTPTAHRLNAIPSNNAYTTSKSTRSTIKNSDCNLYPKKLVFDECPNV